MFPLQWQDALGVCLGCLISHLLSKPRMMLEWNMETFHGFGSEAFANREAESLKISFKWVETSNYMGVFKNNGTPKSSILIGFSIINHPFWGTPIFGNTHIM